MTYWKLVSLDKRLSDRKNPSFSEASRDRFQNWTSVSSLGCGAAAVPPRGTGRTAVAPPVRNKHAKTTRKNRVVPNLCFIVSYLTAVYATDIRSSGRW